MTLLQYLVTHGLAEDEFSARGLILSNRVLIDNEPCTSVAYIVKENSNVRVKQKSHWVSRSAEKLLGALEQSSFNVDDRVFADIGASTGGFTQVLLSKNARKIYAIDVAYGIMDTRIRNNEKVEVIERKHFCELDLSRLKPVPEAFVCDVSFISLQKILSCLIESSHNNWEGMFLFKPQFEAERQMLVKGIIIDQGHIEQLCHDFETFLVQKNIQMIQRYKASVTGSKGNQEFVYHLKLEQQF